MVGQWPRPGHSNHASYGVSGIPYVTGSVIGDLTTERIKFDYVTRFFHVKNTSIAPIYIGFTENGVSGTNRMILSGGQETPVFEMRVRELYLRAEDGAATADVLAGMTTIPRSGYFSVTGSQFVSGAVFLPVGVG